LQRELNILISGGGTGGHIFPAVAIANYLCDNHAPCRIQFIGAQGKMEMEKVPQAGYNIEGLPVAGLQRRLTFSNLLLPVKVLRSIRKASHIISTFKPDVAVGVGGYASGPAMLAAIMKGVPVVIQEQNSFAGITNKWLGKYAKKVCVAYDGMDKFFPADKIVMTGNPVRRDITVNTLTNATAREYFKIPANQKVLLILGGSLGARTINASIENALDKLPADVFVIWQCGKIYYDALKDKAAKYPNISLQPFITNMNLAYAAADIVISRAGALSISELCVVGKPVILVPSPNVAEDHQTHNAMALVKQNAALMVKDIDARAQLVDKALGLLNDETLKLELATHIKQMAKPDADKHIVEQILSVIKG